MDDNVGKAMEIDPTQNSFEDGGWFVLCLHKLVTTFFCLYLPRYLY